MNASKTTKAALSDDYDDAEVLNQTILKDFFPRKRKRGHQKNSTGHLILCQNQNQRRRRC